MSDFLREMADESTARALAARQGAWSSGLLGRVASAPDPMALNLPGPGFDLIAETKLSSPADGSLLESMSPTAAVRALATAYEAGGAAVISVLTEETRFSGTLRHLEAVASLVGVPVMRKDFLVDTVQVLEARAAGASGVLLIAKMLPGALLQDMTDLTLGLGMFAVVEVFDRRDIDEAARVFDRDILVGVNSRDLTSLQVDNTRFELLAHHLPDHLPHVAESGMSLPEEMRAVAALGYRMALVGSSLVTHGDPGRRVAEFLESGRAAIAGAQT